MNQRSIIEHYNLTTIVKDIVVLESKDAKKETHSFFADGFPGILFQQSENATIFPSGKKLTPLFLYGQTVHPIEMVMEGAYKMIVLQVYPFVAQALFQVNTKELNDECYDLHLVKAAPVDKTLNDLQNAVDTDHQVKILCGFVKELADQAITGDMQKVSTAIHKIIESKGLISVTSLCEALSINERTLQRYFVKYVGVSPKKLAKIIQFQSSLDQLSDHIHANLTEIVYESGYADQSHFIRNFKTFTGKRPSSFKQKK